MTGNRALRQRIETAIDGLIAILDAIDGDENLEPYLSSGSRYWNNWHVGTAITVDLEADTAEAV